MLRERRERADRRSSIGQWKRRRPDYDPSMSTRGIVFFDIEALLEREHQRPAPAVLPLTLLSVLFLRRRLSDSAVAVLTT